MFKIKQKNKKRSRSRRQQQKDKEKMDELASEPQVTRTSKKRKTSPDIKEGDEKKKVTSQWRKKRAQLGSGRDTSAGYKKYVYRVIKQVHPEVAISSKAMTIVNNLMNDMFERIAKEASRLARCTGKRTISSWKIQDAVKLVLPVELGKHAIAEGSKAVSNYVSSVNRESKSKSKP